MSNTYRKVDYVSEGGYGSDDSGTLYMHYNGTGNCTWIYREDGTLLFSFTHWSYNDKKDLGDAIIHLLTTHEDKLEVCTPEEIQKIRKFR